MLHRLHSCTLVQEWDNKRLPPFATHGKNASNHNVLESVIMRTKMQSVEVRQSILENTVEVVKVIRSFPGLNKESLEGITFSQSGCPHRTDFFHSQAFRLIHRPRNWPHDSGLEPGVPETILRSLREGNGSITSTSLVSATAFTTLLSRFFQGTKSILSLCNPNRH